MSFDTFNNPFRQRLASQSLPASSSATSSTPPPLPPRKPSETESRPSLPPRKATKARPASSSSSLRSFDSSNLYPPTSTSTPSSLIQQSLWAAQNAQESKKRDDVVVHVISRSSDSTQRSNSLKRMPIRATLKERTASSSSDQSSSSKDPSPSKRTDLIAHVHQALKEAEDVQPKPPPTRARSVRIAGKMDTYAQSYLQKEPGTNLWSCVDLLSGKAKQKPYAMIILNQPITRKGVFLRAWDASELHYCADGGANRLFDIWNPEHRSAYLPTMIKGDLDSIRSDVQSYYASKGVTVKHDGDQYSTDLMKCIAEIEVAERAAGKTYSLLLFGGLSGRIDQTVHTMSLLHKLRKTRPHSYVLSGESLAWVLDEGSHVIEIDHSTMGETCGILPVGVDNAMARTKGLKWNLDGTTSFDGMVSTSNHLLPTEPVVYLSTSRPILWCIEVKAVLPSVSPLVSRRTTSVKTKKDLSRGFQELGMGVLRAAEGVGKELNGWREEGHSNRVGLSEEGERWIEGS